MDELAKLPTSKIAETAWEAGLQYWDKELAKHKPPKAPKAPRRRGQQATPGMGDYLPVSARAADVLVAAGAKDNRPAAVAAREAAAKKRKSDEVSNANKRSRLSISNRAEEAAEGEENAAEDGENAN